MASEMFHEPVERMSEATLDKHRAIISLMEEMEAIDWYQQRIDSTQDSELANILQHNANEEKEHAAMVLEWLRRCDPVLDAKLRQYLFTTETISEHEEEEGTDDESMMSDGSLNIGSLHGEK
ncbi:encapsulin-associated ferritin-like protein [Nitrosococcus wardiae]|uniref:Ferritin n=1 Tax=Nitrosococcus wardiae TaxID=1814290 RepID=A0A4P7C1H1_9GAMM|nr:encapsulin-associated ferritin-like protein [Nitrosococcus wardiae]QBQ55519.1 ferritin [Nitrosococcus wardiae]